MILRFITLSWLIVAMCCGGLVFAQEGVNPPADTALANALPALPPTNLVAKDTPNDKGESVTVTWIKSTDDEITKDLVLGYEIYRTENEGGEFVEVAKVMKGVEAYIDNQCKEGQKYFYKVGTLYLGGVSLSSEIVSAIPIPQWFDWSILAMLIVGALLTFFIIYFIERVKAGKQLFVRKIAGLDAVDEAVGRATEMGRPVLFVPGIMDINDMQTLAGITILGRVAKTIAEYDSELHCPTSRALVMVTAREVVKQAYMEAGRPDAYKADKIHYLTDEQFGYVAGVNGIMMREKPATCLFMGSFYAESLILAETGFIAGAIQIAGTAQTSQIPFFIAACDYTLIGEELFAASAYLSGDPKQVGSLKGNDMGKLFAMLFIGVGTIVATIAGLTTSPVFHQISNFLQRIVTL